MTGLFGGAKTKQTTTTTVPPPSAQELKLLTQQLELATKQLAAISQAGTFTNQLFSSFYPQLHNQVLPFLPAHNAVTGSEMGFLGDQVAAQGDLLQGELAAIKQGAGPTADQLTLIQDAANAAIESGLSDIRSFRDESLRSLAQETAPARGLRPQDTPILDVGGRVINESQRLASDLVSGVRGQEAQMKLDYPIRAGEFIANRTQAQQQLAAGGAQFNEQLRQEAFNNRLRLTALTGEQSLGLAGIGPSPNLLPSMMQVRLGAATTNTTQKGGSTDWGGLLGGVGGVMSGLGSLGFSFSDRRLKEDVRPVGDIGGVTLYKYRFKGLPDEYVGVMADETPPAYVATHPSGYKMVNYPRLFADA